jgi:thiamine-phosphate pyrophosphorylase
VAIGGIDIANTKAAIQAGADGIAVISALITARDPKASAEALLRVIKEAGPAKQGAAA